MATEEGVVVRVEGQNAWVRTRRTSACKHCSARGSCASAGGVDGTEMEAEAYNSANAAIGDHVIVSIESSALLKASFILYVFPIFCMLIGAFAGNAASQFLNLDSSAVSAVFAFVFFGASYLLVRYKGGKMAEEKKYRPKITRIISP